MRFTARRERSVMTGAVEEEPAGLATTGVPRPGRRGEAGMVTAETALALTALVVVTLGMVWVVTAVTLQARCADAARDTARALARGESVVDSEADGRRSAPAGAHIAVGRGGGVATVEVRVDARPAWPVLAHLPPVTVSGRAVVALEPGTP